MQFLNGLSVGVIFTAVMAAALHDFPDLFNANTLPAWMQGVGSLLAVGAAIYVPWKIADIQHQRAEIERRVRARALAYMFTPELHGLEAYVLGLIDVLEQAKAGTLARLNAEGVRAFAGKAVMQLPVGKHLDNHVPEFHILGESVGTDLAQMMVAVVEHNREIGVVATLVSAEFEMLIAALPRLYTIERLRKSALAKLATIQDRPVSVMLPNMV